MLPGEFLTSGDCKSFVLRCMEKDLLLSLKNIRQGRCYVAPCAAINSIVSKESVFLILGLQNDSHSLFA